MRKRSVATVVLLVLGFFVVAGAFKDYSPIQSVRFPFAPSPSELCTIGEPITIALRTYYDDFGRFP